MVSYLSLRLGMKVHCIIPCLLKLTRHAVQSFDYMLLPALSHSLVSAIFYMFSALYLRKSSSFLFAALSFWNIEAQGTTSSTLCALMSWEP